MVGFLRALKLTNALFTPATEVCGGITAPSEDGKVFIYVGIYHTLLIVLPSLVNY